MNVLRMLFGLILILFFSTSLSAQKQIPITTDSEEARTYLARAIHALEQFDNQRTREWAKKAVEADPDFAFGHMLLAMVSPRSQRQTTLDWAEELAAKATRGEHLFLKGLKAYYFNDRRKALDLFTQLHREFPDDRLVIMMIGIIQMELGNDDAAIEAFQQANQLDDRTPRADALIAQCYIMKGEFEKARQFYKRSLTKIDKNATPFPPFFGLSWTYLYQNQPDSALSVQMEYLDRYNRNGAAQGFPPVWIWNQMARIQLEAANRPQVAYEYYEKGYESVPPSGLDSTQKQLWYGRLLHGKARSLAKMGRTDEAWQIAERVKEMLETAGEQGNRYWPAYYYLAGYIKLEAGALREAIRLLEQASLRDPFQKMLLARAAYRSGDRERALKLYREITEYRNNNVERALSYPEAVKMIRELSSNN